MITIRIRWQSIIVVFLAVVCGLLFAAGGIHLYANLWAVLGVLVAVITGMILIS